MNKIFIAAGEASGDLHASRLIKEIKSVDPSVSIMGIGGANMELAGARIFYRTDELAIVGVADIFKHLRRKIKEMFFLFLAEVDKEKPGLVILVDYPGFNLQLLGELKKRRIKIVYYISPQLWAWGKSRIYKIKKHVDQMIVFFAFEGELYKKYGVPCAVVGHPLLDIAKPSRDKNTLFRDLRLDPGKKTIAVLAGSRKREVDALLPIMLEAAAIVRRKYANLQLLVVRSHNLEPGIFDAQLKNIDMPYALAENNGTELYNYLSITDLAMVASGTATLECAIMNVPMIIVYKISLLNAILMKPFIRVPYIGLVNILAGKRVVPELIQFDATPEKIFLEASKILFDPVKNQEIKKEVLKVRESLGKEGASRRAAEIVVGLLA